MHKGRIVLAGGSGFLGTCLARELEARRYEIIILSRTPGPDTDNIKRVVWDGKTLGDWAAWLKGAEAVVNLTGKSVNCRYTARNRREIIDSRVNSVNVIAKALLECTSPPRSWIQASSLAIYGDTGDHACDESSSPGNGFSVDTCKRWEKSFDAADSPKPARCCCE